VYRRLSLRLLCLLLTLALPASAQFTRDNAANKKIDEAINEHYLATDFDKAEGVLTGTVQACGDKCSPQVIARAWMYVGIVRGSGKNDQAGAKEAFQKAIGIDPQVKLDTALATPETQKTFEATGGAGGSAPTPEPPKEKPGGGGGGAEPEGPGGMRCTPDAMEIQTRRPIPVECVSDEEAASVELRYKPFGGDWKTVKMTKKGDAFRGEVPCNDTKTTGDLKVYARAKDAAGETIDNWGSKNKPINYTMGESVTGEPPAYTGETAPERCADSSECPPDFPGCGGGGGGKRGDVDWGGKCENSTECKSGLLCEGGVCETAPSCETNADCTTGVCTAGKCDVGDDVASSAGPYKKNWLGLHFGLDIAIIGGENVCATGGGYECYDAGTRNSPYAGPPFPGTGIATGTAIATQRILLSYDRAFTPNITVGVRIGYALGGGPPAVTGFDQDGNATGKIDFLPFHAEGRATYWIGQGALGKKGIRPYVFAGGGMAQVDAKVPVTIFDCGETNAMGMSIDANGNLINGADCAAGAKSINQTGLPQRKIDAWKKLGQGFAAVGGGIVYAVKEQIGIQANVNLMYMLGSSGPVLEPSLGVIYGL
jgi:hypothetical protein